MCIHGPVALILATLATLLISNPLLEGNFRSWQIATLWGTILMAVPAHAILEFFAVQDAVRDAIPIVRAHCGDLTDQEKQDLMPISLRQKMIFCTLFVTIIPTAVLGATVLLKLNDRFDKFNIMNKLEILNSISLWIIVLFFFSTIVSLAICLLLTNNVANLTEALVQAMREVESGNMRTRLEVVSTDSFGYLYEGFNKMVHSLKERARLRDVISKYISPHMIEFMSSDDIRLEGINAHASVLFADIRGFTTLSEGMTPSEVVELLSSYLSAVEPVIRAQGGWINKFAGDSLLAVFGVPNPQPDHANRAVLAATQMRATLKEFNALRESSGKIPIRIGMGIHCGWLIAGSVGSPERMEYTVIGDAVNVASRLQNLTKEFETDLLISFEVFQALSTSLQTRGKLVELRGKSLPMRVFTVHNELRFG